MRLEPSGQCVLAAGPVARIPNADAGTSLVQRTHNSDNRRKWRSAPYDRRLLRRQRRRSRSIQRFSWSAPEILKPRRRQLCIAHRVLNVAVAEVSLQRSRIVSSVGQCIYPQECRSMCGCALKASLATFPARSIIRAKPAAVNGAPRSEVNTKGDFGSCSRCSRRRARNSWPFLERCTNSRASFALRSRFQ